MFSRIKDVILKLSNWAEVIIAVLIMISVFILGGKLVFDMITTNPATLADDTMGHFLEYCFNLVIGIEFIRMLLKHSVESVVEIVLFSVSREIIVERLTGLETLLIIAALLLIFVIRKYLMHTNTSRQQNTKQQEHIVV